MFSSYFLVFLAPICFFFSILLFWGIRKHFKTRTKLFSPTSSVLFGTFISLFILVYPIASSDVNTSIIGPILNSILKLIQIFTGNFEYGTEILPGFTKVDGNLLRTYEIEIEIFVLLAELATISVLLFTFIHYFTYIRYFFNLGNKFCIFSTLSEQTIITARDLKQKYPKTKLVILNTDSDEVKADYLLEEARSLGALIINKDIKNFRVGFRFANTYILLNDFDDTVNIDDFITMVEKNRFHGCRFSVTDIYLFSSTKEYVPILDKFVDENRRNLEECYVIVVDEYQHVAYDLFFNVPLYENAGSEINLVIIGDGEMARTLVTTASWLGQTNSHSLNIYVGDSEKIEEEHYKDYYPELVNESSNKGFKLEFLPDISLETIREKNPTYIIIASDDEKFNIHYGINLATNFKNREFLEVSNKDNNEPEILIWTQTSSIQDRLGNYYGDKHFTNEKTPQNLRVFGSLEDRYDYNNIFNPTYDNLGFAIHLNYALNYDVDPTLLKNIALEIYLWAQYKTGINQNINWIEILTSTEDFRERLNNPEYVKKLKEYFGITEIVKSEEFESLEETLWNKKREISNSLSKQKKYKRKRYLFDRISETISLLEESYNFNSNDLMLLQSLTEVYGKFFKDTNLTEQLNERLLELSEILSLFNDRNILNEELQECNKLDKELDNFSLNKNKLQKALRNKDDFNKVKKFLESYLQENTRIRNLICLLSERLSSDSYKDLIGKVSFSSGISYNSAEIAGDAYLLFKNDLENLNIDKSSYFEILKEYKEKEEEFYKKLLNSDDKTLEKDLKKLKKFEMFVNGVQNSYFAKVPNAQNGFRIVHNNRFIKVYKDVVEDYFTNNIINEIQKLDNSATLNKKMVRKFLSCFYSSIYSKRDDDTIDTFPPNKSWLYRLLEVQNLKGTNRKFKRLDNSIKYLLNSNFIMEKYSNSSRILRNVDKKINNLRPNDFFDIDGFPIYSKLKFYERGYYIAEYNRRSSLAAGLHTKSKIKEYNRSVTNNLKRKEKEENLCRLEHRRWMYYFFSQGYHRFNLDNLDNFYKKVNNTKSPELKLHVCLVEWEQNRGMYLKDKGITPDNFISYKESESNPDKYRIFIKENSPIDLEKDKFDELELVTLKTWKFKADNGKPLGSDFKLNDLALLNLVYTRNSDLYGLNEFVEEEIK